MSEPASSQQPNVTKLAAETQAMELRKTLILPLHEYKIKRNQQNSEIAQRSTFATERRKSSRKSIASASAIFLHSLDRKPKPRPHRNLRDPLK